MLDATQLPDRYRLKQCLSQASDRQTWLAEDQSTQPPTSVVLKLLTAYQSQWDSIKLFEREATVLQQLCHPRIPRYRDFFPLPNQIGWFGLVQDYIPGRSLGQLLAAGRRFSVSDIGQIAADVLEILIYLHELSPPVIHRDIKPGNVILGDDGHLYLIDFGAVQNPVPAGSSLTIVGTYGYTPMEQFGGRAVPASDLYALGATLIHLVTGVAPAELPQENLRIQFRDRVSLAPDLADWLEQLTDPDLNQRFKTARQALAALPSQATLVAQSPNCSSDLDVSHVKLYRSPDELLIELTNPGTDYLVLLEDSPLEPGTPPESVLPLRTLAAEQQRRGTSSLSRLTWRDSGVIATIVVACLSTLVHPSVAVGVALLLAVGIQRAIRLAPQWPASPQADRTYLYFSRSRNQFAVYRAPFPSLPDKPDGQLSGITALISKPEVISGITIARLNLETTGPTVTIRETLSPADGVWLVQQIEDWLRS